LGWEEQRLGGGGALAPARPPFSPPLTGRAGAGGEANVLAADRIARTPDETVAVEKSRFASDVRMHEWKIIEEGDGRRAYRGSVGRRGGRARRRPGVRRRSRGGRASDCVCGVARSKRKVVGVAVESMTSALSKASTDFFLNGLPPDIFWCRITQFIFKLRRLSEHQ
jgi:hypothetical protein